MENMQNKKSNYRKLFLMLVLSFVVMYTVMFAAVDRWAHVYNSLTRFYMSILMVAPMALMMTTMMRGMYTDKRLNSAIIAGSITVFLTVLVLLRTQTPVGDTQYMKAMIPHHSSAILTSQQANLQDPEVRALARQIIEAQEREIEQMKHILDRIDR